MLFIIKCIPELYNETIRLNKVETENKPNTGTCKCTTEIKATEKNQRVFRSEYIWFFPGEMYRVDIYFYQGKRKNPVKAQDIQDVRLLVNLLHGY